MKLCRLERVDADASVDERGRRAERHAELALEPGRRTVVDENRRHDRIDAHVDRLDIVRAEAFAPLEIEQRVERRMRARARRVELDGDPGVDDFPPHTEIGVYLVQRQQLAVHGGEKSLRALDRRRARRHAGARQHRRGNAVAGREPRVQRLHHRAEVFFQARRLGGRDRQRVTARHGVEARQSRGRRGRADRSERGRAVPAALIVPRIHHASESSFEFLSDHVLYVTSPTQGSAVVEVVAASRRKIILAGSFGCGMIGIGRLSVLTPDLP